MTVSYADSFISGLRLFYTEQQRVKIDNPFLKEMQHNKMDKESMLSEKLPRKLKYLGKITSHRKLVSRVFWRYKEQNNQMNTVSQKLPFLLKGVNNGSEYNYKKGWKKTHGGLHEKIHINQVTADIKTKRCSGIPFVDPNHVVCSDIDGRTRK